MTEGTKSYLMGCHQFFFHPLWVLLAWRLEYKSWPKWWEIIAIFLHDIGICGRQYLSDDEAKKGHWFKGASMAMQLIILKEPTSGRKTYLFCAGHCPEESGYPASKLSRADKRSWLVAPTFWLWCSYWIEWQNKGIGVTKPLEWKTLVAENFKHEKPIGSHELYIRNRK